VSTLVLVTTLNAGLKVVVPLVNNILVQYNVTVPNEIMGVFTLSDLFLEYYDGYTYLGATPTFLPPSNTAQLFVQ
jgi:hypothetical protein